jgi:hypothetical protein
MSFEWVGFATAAEAATAPFGNRQQRRFWMGFPEPLGVGGYKAPPLREGFGVGSDLQSLPEAATAPFGNRQQRRFGMGFPEP